MNLDYSSLSYSVTKADIDAYRAAHPGNLTHLIGWFIAIPAAIIVGSMLLVGVIQLVATGEVSLTLGVMAAIVVLIAVFSWKGARARIKKLVRLHRFAALNNLQFISDYPEPNYTGLIFTEGHTRSVREAFIFNDGSEIGNYVYKTGSGKNQQWHPWGYVRIKLTRNLPHMVLDAKKNNLFGKISNLPASFDKNQVLSLEGEFNDHFTLYAPKEYEQDALYVFTPDVMAAVIDAGKEYEIEVIDNNLMLYTTTHFKLDSEDQLKELFAIINKIGTELRDQTDYYADDRAVSRQADIVAEPGRRLKTKIGVGSVIVFIIILLYWGWIFVQNFFK